jgi:MbtH protein
MSEQETDTRPYQVVVNDEEQYSIWPQNRPLPAGWAEVGICGVKEECLAHIEKVWVDMRPLSLRRSMAAAAAGA